MEETLQDMPNAFWPSTTPSWTVIVSGVSDTTLMLSTTCTVLGQHGPSGKNGGGGGNGLGGSVGGRIFGGPGFGVGGGHGGCPLVTVLIFIALILNLARC